MGKGAERGKVVSITAARRPMPPADLADVARLLPDDKAAFLECGLTVPAPDVQAWMRATFIDAGGPLVNPAHEHLQGAVLGVLWTNAPNRRRGVAVIGQAELPEFRGGWAKARQEQQLVEWFGCIPDFVLTFYAPAVASMGGAEWCALVEHELYHCGQALDAFGAPRFSSSTGRPVFCLKAHDVEEFVGVVERYGAGAGAGRTAELVAAANRGPSIAPARVAAACGTCGRRTA